MNGCQKAEKGERNRQYDNKRSSERGTLMGRPFFSQLFHSVHFEARYALPTIDNGLSRNSYISVRTE